MVAAGMLDFGGRKINIIQIGLGTNSTFVQNLAGSRADWNKNIAWLMEPMSEFRPAYVEGIAVEPVEDLVEELRPLMAKLPGVQLVQAALGERDAVDAEIVGLRREVMDALLEQVPPHKRARLENDLEYMRNMSCIGYEHPLLPMCQKNIETEYDVKLDMEDRQKVEVWSWRKLVTTLNFRGCEVLLVDAEGFDVRILRSLVEHCREHPESWPELIQFETMGHCDRQDGLGAERQMLALLQREGYTVVSFSDHNTHLVRSALFDEWRFRKWLAAWRCCDCGLEGSWPYVSTKRGIRCEPCHEKAVAEGWLKPLNFGCKLDDLTSLTWVPTTSEPCSKRHKA